MGRRGIGFEIDEEFELLIERRINEPWQVPDSRDLDILRLLDDGAGDDEATTRCTIYGERKRRITKQDCSKLRGAKRERFENGLARVDEPAPAARGTERLGQGNGGHELFMPLEERLVRRDVLFRERDPQGSGESERSDGSAFPDGLELTELVGGG